MAARIEYLIDNKYAEYYESEILDELQDDIIDTYLMTGDNDIRIDIAIPAGCSEELNECYSEDIDTIYVDAREFIEERLDSDEILDLLDILAKELKDCKDRR